MACGAMHQVDIRLLAVGVESGLGAHFTACSIDFLCGSHEVGLCLTLCSALLPCRGGESGEEGRRKAWLP